MKKDIITIAVIGILLLSSLMITPALGENSAVVIASGKIIDNVKDEGQDIPIYNNSNIHNAFYHIDRKWPTWSAIEEYDSDSNLGPSENVVSNTLGVTGTTWTIMAYIDGDNNLEEVLIDIINQFEGTGSTDNVKIVAQIDRGPGYDTSNGDWTSMRRYYITKDENGFHEEITSELILDLGEESMGDPNVLEDFIYWAVTEYPADHYCLFLADHGHAWEYVCIDWTNNNDTLTMIELKNSLNNIYERTGKKLDILCFNACVMANVEVYYQLKDYVNIIIGSENSQFGNLGYRYFINDLVNNPSWNAEQFAREIIQDTVSMSTPSVLDLSAIDLDKFEDVVEKVNIFAGYLREIVSENANLISDVIYSSLHMHVSLELYDLWDFANETQNYFFFVE